MVLPVPVSGNGHTDGAVRAVRAALMAVHYRCDRDNDVSTALPGLIRDLHSSIAAGRDVAELSELAVVLPSGATLGWLRLQNAVGRELRGIA